MSFHSYTGGLRVTACCHQHRWNATLGAGSNCAPRGNIRLLDVIRPPSPLWQARGRGGELLGVWTGLRHPPEGPTVRRRHSLQSQTARQLRVTLAASTSQASCRYSKTSCGPQAYRGRIEKKSCGAQTMFFPKKVAREVIVCNGILWPQVSALVGSLGERRSEVTSRHRLYRLGAEAVQESTRHRPSQSSRGSRQPQA